MPLEWGQAGCRERSWVGGCGQVSKHKNHCSLQGLVLST